MASFSVKRETYAADRAEATVFACSRTHLELVNPAAGTLFKASRRAVPLQMRIHFDANGGTAAYVAATRTAGEKIGELPSASNRTKLFLGWFDGRIGGNQIAADSVVSEDTALQYAHWKDPTVLRIDPNGGSVSFDRMYAYNGYPLGSNQQRFPDAVGPADRPNCIGFYTLPDGGTQVDESTIYDGSYSVVYPRYSARSYTVELNGQWFKDDRSGKDPNGKAYGTAYSTNPDASRYDGTYVSYGNFNVNSGWAKMRIRFIGYSEFVVYIRSYAESNYDYTVIGSLDQNITSNPSSGYERTYGSQTSGTSISNYKKVTYSNLDGGEHFVDVVFRKDGSVNSNQDRGYVLIPK